MKKDLINAFLSLLLTATMLGLVFNYEKTTKESLLTGNSTAAAYPVPVKMGSSYLNTTTDSKTPPSAPCYIDHEARPDYLH